MNAQVVKWAFDSSNVRFPLPLSKKLECAGGARRSIRTIAADARVNGHASQDLIDTHHIKIVPTIEVCGGCDE